MYADMFRAEWQKIGGNRLLVISLVWIFPIIAAVVLGIFILVALGAPDRAELAVGFPTWDEALVQPWLLINNELGRWIIAAFAGIIFAGEYSYGTWKNFVIHRSRLSLLLTKFVTLAAYMLLAWLVMSLVVFVGMAIISSIIGSNFGSFDSATVGNFLRDYSLQVVMTLAASLIAASYAALAAMFTRNILASAFIAVLFNAAENGIVLPLALLKQFVGIDLLNLYYFTPTYNLQNITSWLIQGRGNNVFFEATNYPPHTLAVSLLIVVAWVVGLVSLATWRFRRQDIVT